MSVPEAAIYDYDLPPPYVGNVRFSRQVRSVQAIARVPQGAQQPSHDHLWPCVLPLNAAHVFTASNRHELGSPHVVGMPHSLMGDPCTLGCNTLPKRHRVSVQ